MPDMEEQERLLRETYEDEISGLAATYHARQEEEIKEHLNGLIEEIKDMEDKCTCTDHAREVSKQDSIKVARNAKGDYSWDVKLYFDNETEQYSDTLKRLGDITEELRRGYGN